MTEVEEARRGEERGVWVERERGGEGLRRALGEKQRSSMTRQDGERDEGQLPSPRLVSNLNPFNNIPATRLELDTLSLPVVHLYISHLHSHIPYSTSGPPSFPLLSPPSTPIGNSHNDLCRSTTDPTASPFTMSIWSWLSAPSDPPPEPTAPPRPSSAASPNLVHSTQGGGGATDKEAETGVEAQTALASWQALLEPFKEGVLPEKARTDPTVKQLQAKPMTVLGLWQYVPFVAKQSASSSFSTPCPS